MFNFNINFRKKILFVLLLLIFAFFLINSAFIYFFTYEIKQKNRQLYHDFTSYITDALEKDNLDRQENIIQTIAEYGVAVFEDPKDDVFSCQQEVGEFLSEFYKEKLFTEKGREELIDEYFVPRASAQKYINLNKHVYWGVDTLHGKSSDALLFTLDSLKILKDSNPKLIKSVFLKTINNLCIAYPVRSVLTTAADFQKLELLKEETNGEQSSNQKNAYINNEGNLVLWSRFSSLSVPGFDFIIAAVLDFRMIMEDICSYAWKRDIEAALLIDNNGNVIFYDHSREIPDLDNVMAVGKCLYNYGSEKVAKTNEHIELLKNQESGFFYFTLNNNEYYAGFSAVENMGWKMLFITGEDDIRAVIAGVKENIRSQHSSNIISVEKFAIKVQIILFVLLIVVFVLFVAVGHSVTGKLTKSLSILSRGVEKITNGDLTYKLPIFTSKDEFEKLGNAFNKMVDSINQYIRDLAITLRAKEEVEADIKIAADIQKSMLPQKLVIPDSDNFIGLQLAATLIPSKMISGDFYDYFMLDNENLFFAIGDISGKGVPASLFMVTIKTMIKEYILRNKSYDLGVILQQLNETVARDNYSCMFATIFCGILNLKNGIVKYASAAHPMPVYYSSKEEQCIKLPDEKCHVLGAFKRKIKFNIGELVLNKGDLLVLFTDGITEAANPERVMWGINNLEQTVSINHDHTPNGLISDIKSEVETFTAASVSKSDDFTLLIFKREK